MVERMTIVDGDKIAFKGLFDFRELYNLIDAFLWQKGFDKRIAKNEEHIEKDGKFINVIMQPWKIINDYLKHEIKIVITVHHAREETREIESVKKKLTNGAFEAKFYGYLLTDYENKWESSPMNFFLRTVFDKFVYKFQNNNSAAMLRNDVRQLKSEVESFLNLKRFT